MIAPTFTDMLTRLQKLHELIRVAVDHRKIKVDAWFIKKSCVLIKKKIMRAQWPNNPGFVQLMNLLDGDDNDDEQDEENQDQRH